MYVWRREEGGGGGEELGSGIYDLQYRQYKVSFSLIFHVKSILDHGLDICYARVCSVLGFVQRAFLTDWPQFFFDPQTSQPLSLGLDVHVSRFTSSIYLFVPLPIVLFIYLSIYRSTYLISVVHRQKALGKLPNRSLILIDILCSFTYLYILLPFLSNHSSIYLPTYLSICLSYVCLYCVCV